jgi:pilus assembly protein FimV
MKFKAAALGGILLIHTLTSYALTLGAIQGNAWLGRRLDVSVTAQLDAGQSAAALCATADVFHADTQVDGSRVRVLAEPTDKTNEVRLRIVSSATVDEPVVSVRLRVGCESEVVRRYVLLPDAPTEVIPLLPTTPAVGTADVPVAPRAELWESPASAQQPKDAPAGNVNPTAVPKRTSPAKPAKKEAAAPAKPLTKAPVAAAPSPPAAGPGAGRGKLTLEPLIIPIQNTNVVEPPATPVPTEEETQTAQRMALLQAEIKTLLDQAAVNAANQRDLMARLQKAEEARFQDAFVYGFAGLLALCLLGTVMYLRRAALQIRVLENERLTRVLKIAPAPTAPPREQEIPSESTAPSVQPSASLEEANWLDEDEKGLSVLRDGIPTGPAALEPLREPHQPFVNTGISLPDFNAEDQLALIDQARLFVRLEKTAQAIDVLEERIRVKAADCPLVFLELLKIANEFSLKVDFRQFRDEMQQVFNVAVPEFALFKAEGRKLVGYPELSQRLTKLGQTPQALTEIESYIVLSAWGNNTEALDLAAFKDLVHLHGAILKALQSSNETSSSAEPGASESLTDVDLPL